jgi:mannose-1-phosphate guanylyltransferase
LITAPLRRGDRGKENIVLYAVILAGGRGERFWPWSRKDRPKQLLPITGSKTMLEETVERILPLIPEERILLVTGQELAGVIARECPRLRKIRVVAEPKGRNTAAAIGLGAILLRQEDPQAVMAVLSADHQITPQDRFLKALTTAAHCVQEEDRLVTFGIPPTRPETGYGYIELGPKLSCEEGGAVYQVKEFKEKPSRMVAQQFYLDREHLWNSGMFVWKVDTILEAMAEHMPQLREGLETVAGAPSGPRRNQAIEDLYERIDAVSIDYGIMEKAANVVVVQGDFRWDDVGTWSSLRRIHKPDANGIVTIGDGLAADSYDCILAGEGPGLIATLGVSDLIIVRTESCVLVAHASRAQDVRQLVEQLAGRPELKKYQ